MTQTTTGTQALVKTVLLLAAMVLLLWFLHAIRDVLLLSFFAVVLAIVLNAPATWLEGHGWPRWAAALTVFVAVAALVGLLGWLIVPRLAREVGTLLNHLPEYLDQSRQRLSSLFDPYPKIKKELPLKAEDAGAVMPSLPALVKRTTTLSLSLFEGLAVILVLLAMVVYAVIRPRPLLRLYLELFPVRLRERAAKAFARASVMLVGWIWSNIVMGSIEAVLSGVVLWLLGVPAALVWAALALFAELIPKVGIYVMAIPPVLVALAVDPMKAVWVALFYTAMNETLGNFLTPRLRASAMNLHTVSILFVMLAMAAAFGLLGALIATPIAAFIKCYFEEFYPPARRAAADEEAMVERMLTRDAGSASAEGDGS